MTRLLFLPDHFVPFSLFDSPPLVAWLRGRFFRLAQMGSRTAGDWLFRVLWSSFGRIDSLLASCYGADSLRRGSRLLVSRRRNNWLSRNGWLLVSHRRNNWLGRNGWLLVSCRRNNWLDRNCTLLVSRRRNNWLDWDCTLLVSRRGNCRLGRNDRLLTPCCGTNRLYRPAKLLLSVRQHACCPRCVAVLALRRRHTALYRLRGGMFRFLPAAMT